MGRSPKNANPYLWALTQNEVTRPLFVAALLDQEALRAFVLPKKVLRLRRDEEITFIGLIARAHYKHTGGALPCFGPITGYTYARAPGQNWKFTPDGKLISFNAKTISKIKYSLTLKGKPTKDISLLIRRRRR